MAFEITNYTSYATIVAANSDLKAKVWQMKVTTDARRKNALREMVGDGETTMMPIRRVRDLQKGGGEEVIMTTVANVGGQGTLHEAELRPRTAKLRFGTWKIAVDLLRHAISRTQLLKLLRFPGDTVENLSADIMAEWLQRKEEDDLQVLARRTCLLVAPGTNLFYAGDATSLATLESADTLTTTILERGKGLLTSLGAKEIGLDRDVSGSEILKFMAFAPDVVARSLRSSQAWLQALREADSRGPENRLFTGKYGLWDNVALYVHNLISDTSAGRLGSPLMPHAYLGTALADATPTTITGGGHTSDAVAASGAENDFFANFPGYLWKFTEGETPPTDSGTHYAMIYNLTGADKGKYEVFSYTTGNNGNTITGVTRGATTGLNGNVIANAASRFTDAHPSGSIILPCTINGVIWSPVMFYGGAALGWAIGSDDAVPIEEYSDFRKVGNEKDSHIRSVGLQSVRGFEAAKDTNGRRNGVAACICAVSIPGITPEAYVAT
jgi:N4-gp56 family major capsid protein